MPILSISEVPLILLFPASHVFESTVTAGGDTPSHFISASAMSRGLQVLFSPVTWILGACGFGCALSVPGDLAGP